LKRVTVTKITHAAVFVREWWSYWYFCCEE